LELSKRSMGKFSSILSMDTRRILLPCFLLLIAITTLAQNAAPWKNKKCAVVLTYDDALNVHLDKAIPVLDSLGLKGTFYLSAYFPGSKNRISDWKKVAINGHELANHTLFHPCIGKIPGREWVNAERDMDSYSINRLLEEIRMTNVFLQSLDGKTKRTFAYPCGDMTVKGVSYVDSIKNDFVSARGVSSVMHTVNNVDLFNVGSYMISNKSGDELIALVKEAMKTNRLLVFLFHGVGGEHGLNVDLKPHSQLLHFLKQNEKDIWVAPYIDVVEYIKTQNKPR
jgi:peptidoglycan-N-acetylglucosamine deacetylase